MRKEGTVENSPICPHSKPRANKIHISPLPFYFHGLRLFEIYQVVFFKNVIDFYV
jgi:hypothetical protein